MLNHHIIVAAGSGSRFGGDLPKQFCLLAGRPLLFTTMERLHAAAPDAEIHLVLSASMLHFWADLCSEYSFTLPHTVVAGGASRAESVRNALAGIAADGCGWISVHDAARPLVTPELFASMLELLPEADGVIPAVPVTDSLRLLDIAPTGASRAVDRSLYRAVQTPQLFHGSRLIEANRLPLRPDFTDDASVMEAAGFTRLLLSPGDPRNIKVTNPGDIEIAEMHIKSF